MIIFQRRKGFTLIEMLIVVVIIGILAAALIPRLTGAQERARDMTRKKDLQEISSALRVYKEDHGAYPLAKIDDPKYARDCETFTDPKVQGSCAMMSQYWSWKVDKWIAGLVPEYISPLPKDPINKNKSSNRYYTRHALNAGGRLYAYQVIYSANRRYFTLSTLLENTQDQASCLQQSTGTYYLYYWGVYVDCKALFNESANWKSFYQVRDAAK